MYEIFARELPFASKSRLLHVFMLLGLDALSAATGVAFKGLKLPIPAHAPPVIKVLHAKPFADRFRNSWRAYL